MSKQMTPCKKLGYKVGDKFKVVDGTGVHYAVGSFITLIHDDGSSCPRFNGVHAIFESGDSFFPLDFVEKVANLKPAKQALADAINQNGWWVEGGDWHKNGELPPVGEVCEAYIDYPPQWVETEIVAHKDGFAIGWCKSVMKGCHGDKAHEFRPLRTERDKAIDEMMSVAAENWGNLQDCCERLYEYGYRKEVK